ncbi:MAG: signal peptidase II [Planctomycetaceae bacterium]
MSLMRSQAFRLLLGFAILSSCVGCDQATKRLATQALRDAPARSYLADTIRLEYALNPGGFLGLGGRLPQTIRPWVFIGFNSFLLLAIVAFMVARRDMSAGLFAASACMLAGGIGNLIDRIANQGLVTDFLIVGVGPLRTGVFNVADMAVLFGGIVATILVTRAEKSGQPEA